MEHLGALLAFPETVAISLLVHSLTQRSIRALLCAGLLLVSSRGWAYEIDNRWTTTAHGSTGVRGNAITLTWGLVADGTTISGSEGSSGSTLISFLDTHIGAGDGGADLTSRPWFFIFESSFARIGSVSGVTYVYEPNDSGQPIDSSPSPQGQLGVRPDIRIGAHPIDGGTGANTLAYSYFPNHSDLVLDTDNVNFYTNSSNNYRPFRNILMHESGHGLGLHHVNSNNAAFLFEPILNNNFDGPQLDDILGLQRNYGDAWEKNGGNDVFGNATMLGSLVDAATLRIGTLGDSLVVTSAQTDFISIDGTSDIDFFSFTLERTLDVALNLTPRGATYNAGPEGGTQTSQNTKAFSDLTLALFGPDGTTLIQQANNTGAGLAESIALQLNPGTYYARVTGAFDEVQLYGLDVSGTRVAAGLVWTGTQSNQWNVEATANFADNAGAIAFYDADSVTFDDTAATHTVNIAENVSPASVTVNTSGVYAFVGPGGIAGGNLTLLGGGTLELANDGNFYAGTTNVQQGNLVVVSSTGAGDTIVHNGARLAGSGSIGGNLNALSGSTILPGSTLLPSTVNLEGDDTLTVDGNFTQALNAVLEVQLRSVADFDALIVSGLTSLGGTLAVELGEGFTATLGDRFDILTSLGGVTGMFTDWVLPDLGALLAFDTIYEANTVALTIVTASVSLPGDFNGDGKVDGRDFLVWQRNPSIGNLADWQAHYGASEMAAFAARFAVTSASVPEPAAGVILLIGLAVLVGRRRPLAA